MLNIRIDVVRSLCEKINQTSQFGGYRIAILDEADKLTISAANSLLKTLEEPGQNVLILLVTSRTQSKRRTAAAGLALCTWLTAGRFKLPAGRRPPQGAG